MNMNKIVVAGVAAALVSVGACQQAASTAPPVSTTAAPIVSVDASAEKVAVQLVNDWLKAIPARDTTRIANVLADDFVAILPDGRKVSKAEHLKEVASGSYRPTSFSLDDTNARVFGDTVVVTYYQMEEASAGGGHTSTMTAWTDVLAKRDGQWRIVAEHGSNFN